MSDDYGRNVANDDQVREWAKALRADRALADDLHAAYTRLYECFDGQLSGHLVDEFQAAEARYREARGR